MLPVHNLKQKSGFTLTELTVVLVIIPLITGMTVASGVSVISSARLVATNNKMAAIDQALMAFRIANDRIPCPSDLSQVQGSATYGTEGACTAIANGVFVTQNAAATATAAEGGVPTVALGLPNDFMYDGWGNRIRYAVDTGMTTTGSFSGSPIGGVCGAITLTTGGIVAYPAAITLSSGAIYALISHGPNGHGAVTKNALVYDDGSLNTDELTNCHCTSTGAAGTYAPTYVQEAPYTYQAIAKPNSNYNFDDIVTYRERWQMQTTWDKVGTGCSNGVYSRTITIDHTKVGTVNNTDQANFPVLFSGTYSYLATQANGGNVTNANGYDITFTSDAAGKIVLPFERESYNATTGAVTFWVQVPTVSHSTDTVIYLQYDNPTITTDPSNKNGVWDSNYMGVWHLGETSGTANADSTNHILNATKASSTQPNPVTGQIAGAQQYNNSGTAYTNPTDYNTVSDNAVLDFGANQNFTVSAWVNTSESGANFLWPCILSKDDAQTTRSGYNLILHNTTSPLTWYFEIGVAGTLYEVYGTSNIANGSWHYLAGQRSGSTIYSYQDGAAANSLAASSGSVSKAVPLEFGSMSNSSIYGTGNNFVGSVDEIHISNVARSADWIKTEYNNQNSPSTFYTVGAAVSR